MTLQQFNEAYRDMLDSGEWAVARGTGGVVRCEWTRDPAMEEQGGIPFTTCPVSAVASYRLGGKHWPSGYATAAMLLDMPVYLALYLAQVADYGGSQVDPTKL